MTRAYTAEPVDALVVDEILDLARRGPSAGKTDSLQLQDEGLQCCHCSAEACRVDAHQSGVPRASNATAKEGPHPCPAM